MNYTINYPGTTGTINVLPVTMNGQGQRTIVLSQHGSTPGNSNNHAGGQHYPVVMQVGSSTPPMFYSYQNSDALLNSSPVQKGLNMQSIGNSPTIPAVNIQADNKGTVSRSLGDILNVQTLQGMGNSGSLIQSAPLSNTLPVTQQGHSSGAQSNTDIANMLSSLQAAGIQIVDSANTSKSALSVPVLSTQAAAGEHDFITSLPVTNQVSTPVNNMYKIIEGGGNVTLITAGSNDSKNEQSVTSVQKKNMPEIGRYLYNQLMLKSGIISMIN